MRDKIEVVAMATRIPCLVVVVLVLVLTLASFIDVADGFKLSPEKVKAIQTVKKAYASRSKRYTDFQESASAFCTGLCMWEERKSYSDCFDKCNYHYYY